MKQKTLVDLDEAQSSLIISQVKLSQAVILRQQIETNLAVKRAKASLEAALRRISDFIEGYTTLTLG